MFNKLKIIKKNVQLISSLWFLIEIEHISNMPVFEWTNHVFLKLSMTKFYVIPDNMLKVIFQFLKQAIE